MPVTAGAASETSSHLFKLRNQASSCITVYGVKSVKSTSSLQFARMAKHGIMAIAISLVASGCAVGPDFKSPESPSAADKNSYTPTALPAQTVEAGGKSGDIQRFNFGEDIPAQWWSLFHSEALDT